MGRVGLWVEGRGAGAIRGDTLLHAVDGRVTFWNVTLVEARAATVLGAYAEYAPGIVAARTPPFDVAPGTAAALVINGQPQSTVAGETLSPVAAHVIDACGNVASNFDAPVTVSLVGGPSDAELLGTTSLAFISGAATFSDLVLERAGSYALQVGADGLPGAQTDPFTVGEAPADRYALSGPASARVGEQVAFGVAVRDRFGNDITDYQGVADATCAPGSCQALVGITAGRGSFSLRFPSSGTQQIVLAERGGALRGIASIEISPSRGGGGCQSAGGTGLLGLLAFALTVASRRRRGSVTTAPHVLEIAESHCSVRRAVRGLARKERLDGRCSPFHSWRFGVDGFGASALVREAGPP